MYQRTLFTRDLSLFEALCETETLREGFHAVKRNKGSAGVDGISIEAFETNLDEELAQLVGELKSWCYKPLPVRRVEIPKGDGKGTRKLGVPAVRDRVVQAALNLILEPIFEPIFSDNSFGFRIGRSQKQAIKRVKSFAESGKEYVVDIDLEKFFDTICQDRLIAKLSLKIDDKRILRLIGLTLRSGVMENGTISATLEGTTQGSPLSPLLSNAYLDELDKELERRGLSFCRWADDCNIYVKTRKAADRVMKSVTRFIENRMKLKVNEAKSRTAPSKEVKFLGMTIVDKTIAISKKAIDKAMEKVKELTPRRTNRPIEKSIAEISSWFDGWCGYFHMTQYPSQLRKIEAHIRRRLRVRLIVQQKRRRFLVQKLVKLGVKPGAAWRALSGNKGKWALSHTRAPEQGWSNQWFESRGQVIWSNRELEGWFDVKLWIKLT